MIPPGRSTPSRNRRSGSLAAVTDRLERLINLVIALRETRVPLPAATIRERVAGYGHGDREAFRRMFERDKADLRGLGVPVDTAPIDAWGDQVGYRIDPRNYDLPELHLGPDELTALALAVDATGLGDQAAVGLRKLEVDAGDPQSGRAPGGRAAAFAVTLDAPHRDALLAAQLSRTAVAFRYRPAKGRLADRTVDPHGLVHRRGRWYLVGRDHARDDRRAFRLDRIEGAPRTVGEAGAFTTPAAVGVDDVVPAAPPGAPETATVAATTDVAWQVARRSRGAGSPEGDWTVYEVPVGDPDAFVAWVLEHGPDVVVRAPVTLRAQVMAALEHLVDGQPE